MKNRPQFALAVSILTIILYWTWILFNLREVPIIPANFTDFVAEVVLKKIFIVAVVIALVKFQHQGSASLGLTIEQWPKHLLTGLLLGALMFILINVGLTSILNSVFPPKDTGGVMQLFKDPDNLAVWLLIGIFGGGFVEEVQRIFVITRFEQWLGKAGLVTALVLTSVFFGIGHLYQGTGAGISTGVSGLCFGLIYLRQRSALAAIIAHAFSDILAILAAFYLAR